MERDDPVFMAFAARQAATDLTDAPIDQASPSLGHVLAYAKRSGNVADLRMERCLLETPHWRRLYLDQLRGTAVAFSDHARAASEQVVLSRDIGSHRLELIDDVDGAILLITLSDPQSGVYCIEARAPTGTGVRLDLGQPVGTALQVLLSDDFPETKALKALLVQPDTILFLILKAGPK
ncbi:hypothetical protein [Roseinatronobacter sp. NSM]|uniref:hypothetical protein n=1 Tax=Roseinatronobacter sp. NSM TaxID=3457785 RepID=UPI0040365B9F